MITMTNVENIKLDIINWIQRTDNEHLIYKLEELRLNELDLKTELTEDQKRAIIESINTLEE